jgi:hypothetical protein
MNFKARILSSLLIAAACVSTTAGATSIDFVALAPNTSVTDQYANVVFSLAGGNDSSGTPTTTQYYQQGGYDNAYGGLTNTNSGGSYPTAEYLIATFFTPVTGVTFSFNNAGYNGANKFALYDSLNNLITSGALSSYGSIFYDVSAFSNVSSIVWDNGQSTGGNWWQSLQSVSFTADPSSVPEPGSIALLGLGLAGLLASRRKAK